MVIKTDTDLPERMSQRRPVDVITCAAPNLREYLCGAVNPGRGGTVKLSDTELHELHRARGEKILQVAAVQGTDILILGASSCGLKKLAMGQKLSGDQQWAQTMQKCRRCKMQFYHNQRSSQLTTK